MGEVSTEQQKRIDAARRSDVYKAWYASGLDDAGPGIGFLDLVCSFALVLEIDQAKAEQVVLALCEEDYHLPFPRGYPDDREADRQKGQDGA